MNALIMPSGLIYKNFLFWIFLNKQYKITVECGLGLTSAMAVVVVGIPFVTVAVEGVTVIVEDRIAVVPANVAFGIEAVKVGITVTIDPIDSTSADVALVIQFNENNSVGGEVNTLKVFGIKSVVMEGSIVTVVEPGRVVTNTDIVDNETEVEVSTCEVEVNEPVRRESSWFWRKICS